MIWAKAWIVDGPSVQKKNLSRSLRLDDMRRIITAKIRDKFTAKVQEETEKHLIQKLTRQLADEDLGIEPQSPLWLRCRKRNQQTQPPGQLRMVVTVLRTTFSVWFPENSEGVRSFPNDRRLTLYGMVWYGMVVMSYDDSSRERRGARYLCKYVCMYIHICIYSEEETETEFELFLLLIRPWIKTVIFNQSRLGRHQLSSSSSSSSSFTSFLHSIASSPRYSSPR